MPIDKHIILAFLRGDGRHQQADQASRELPDQVDTDQHAFRYNSVPLRSAQPCMESS
jgi:hypothetical protein